MHRRYLVAKLLSPVFGCSTRALRLQNALALSFIFYKVLQIRRLVQPQGHNQRKEDDVNGTTTFSTTLTAFNIACFPPLFFFGALYYTDVMSTAAVLINFQAFVETTAKSQRSISDDVVAILSGIVALSFRQTNIFWVAVFPAGLTVIQILSKNGRISSGAAKQGYLAVLQESWSKRIVYDRSLGDGGLEISGKLLPSGELA